MPDHLAAFDDQLVERLQACVLCGRGGRGQAETWTLGNGLTLLLFICQPCLYRHVESWKMAQARLERIYGGPGGA